MANFDLKTKVSVANALDVTAVSANGATSGEIIDTKGFGSIVFVPFTGTLTDGTYTLSIQEGDNSALSDAATATDIIGSAALSTSNSVGSVGYYGKKRYVRAVVTASSVTTGGSVGAVAVLGNASVNPPAYA